MKKSKILPVILTALILTGCSLARAEEAPSGSAEDRFIGFYVVCSQNGLTEFYSNPNLENYGTITAETDQFGTLDFPQEVLFAIEDAAGNYTFPGMEGGYSLFLVKKEEEYGSVNRVVSNMAPGEDPYAIVVTDSGETNSISGTVYCGPPLNAENWDPYDSSDIWHILRVYQTPDGRVYTDGSGSSFDGGGGFGYSATEAYTTTLNGESTTDTLEISFRLETVPRLEKLVVTQFDEGNAIIRTDDLSLRGDLPEVACVPSAAWVLVEETDPDSVTRTVYNVPTGDEDPISHQIVLLDNAGLGHLSYLTIQ